MGRTGQTIGAAMTKVILMLILVGVSTNAMAEWVLLEVHADSANNKSDKSFVIYADPASIHKMGEKVKLWVLYDYRKPVTMFNKTFRSIKMQWEIDCKGEQYSIPYVLYTSLDMGKGEIVFDADTSGKKATPVVPDSFGESVFEYACGKK